MDIFKSTGNDIFDILLRDALTRKYKDEVENADYEHHNYPDTFKKKIRKIGNSVNRYEKISIAGKIIVKLLVNIAAVMGIVFGMLLTQPKVYAAVVEVAKQIFTTHDKYLYQDIDNEMVFDKNRSPSYIPYGYELRSVFYAKNNVVLLYESADEKIIDIDYGLAENSSVSIDNERHIFKELKKDNTLFYFYKAIEDDEFNMLVWYKDRYYYIINAQLGLDEIMKIAESI